MEPKLWRRLRDLFGIPGAGPREEICQAARRALGSSSEGFVLDALRFIEERSREKKH